MSLSQSHSSNAIIAFQHSFIEHFHEQTRLSYFINKLLNIFIRFFTIYVTYLVINIIK